MTQASIKNLLLKANSALLNQQYKQAHHYLLQALQISPQCADAFYLLAKIPLEFGNLDKALSLIDRALKLVPTQAEYLLFKAKIFSLKSDPINTKKWASKVSIEQLGSAFDCDALGVLYSQLGWHKKACLLFKQAISKNKNEANFYYNLATSLKFLGDFSKAETAYEDAIILAPQHYKAHFALTSLGGITLQRNHIDRLKQLIKNMSDGEDHLYMSHALASELEAVADYEQAFSTLNDAKQQWLKSIDYSFKEDELLFQAIQQLFSSNDQNFSAGFENDQAIFVVGMPRTGTTLVERIISNHSQVHSVGELHHFEMLLKRSLNTSMGKLDSDSIFSAAKIDFNALGQGYINSITHQLAQGEKFVDQLPLNVLFAGFIIKALPNCKIICLHRNGLDTVMSNYRQIFSPQYSYCNYSFELESTAKFYQEFEKLAFLWQQLFPENFMIVNYEALAENPTEHAQKILKFCRLPWQDDCVKIEDNLSSVATASAVQVRKPITTANIGNWKKYQSHLASIQSLLQMD